MDNELKTLEQLWDGKPFKATKVLNDGGSIKAGTVVQVIEKNQNTGILSGCVLESDNHERKTWFGETDPIWRRIK